MRRGGATDRDQPPTERRTQAERRAATRQRLLEATIDGLAQVGYSQFSTTTVAQRAGVSRGALSHHYACKADLVADALDHLLERQHHEFEQAFAPRPEHERGSDAAIDALWKLFESETFAAWLELTTAARTDRLLRSRLAAVDERFRQRVVDLFTRLFRADPEGPMAPAAIVDFVFTVMTGAALQRVIGAEGTPQAVTTLKHLAAVFAVTSRSEDA